MARKDRRILALFLAISLAFSPITSVGVKASEGIAQVEGSEVSMDNPADQIKSGESTGSETVEVPQAVSVQKESTEVKKEEGSADTLPEKTENISKEETTGNTPENRQPAEQAEKDSEDKKAESTKDSKEGNKKEDDVKKEISSAGTESKDADKDTELPMEGRRRLLCMSARQVQGTLPIRVFIWVLSAMTRLHL